MSAPLLPQLRRRTPLRSLLPALAWALLPLALLGAAPEVARADDEAARAAWQDVTRWIQDARPERPTKAKARTFRQGAAKRIESFLERHPDAPNRVDAEQVLGETYVALKIYPKAIAVYEPMAADDDDARRASIGRYGWIKALVEADKLKDARERLDAFLERHPDDKDLKKFDAFLVDRMDYEAAQKALSKLRTGKDFPSFEGQELGSGQVFRLDDVKGKAVLIGFYMTHKDSGTPYPDHATEEVKDAQALAAKYGEKLVVVGVPLDADEARLRAFLDANGVGYRQLANGRAIGRKVGVSRLPMWVVLDPRGRIVGIKLRGKSALDKAVAKAAMTAR